MLGPSIDAASIGNANDPVPVHQEGLSHGIRYVEALTKNLGELPEHGGVSWMLCTQRPA